VVGDYKPVEGIMFAFAMENGRRAAPEAEAHLLQDRSESDARRLALQDAAHGQGRLDGRQARLGRQGEQREGPGQAPATATKKSGTTKTDK